MAHWRLLFPDRHHSVLLDYLAPAQRTRLPLVGAGGEPPQYPRHPLTGQCRHNARHHLGSNRPQTSGAVLGDFLSGSGYCAGYRQHPDGVLPRPDHGPQTVPHLVGRHDFGGDRANRHPLPVVYSQSVPGPYWAYLMGRGGPCFRGRFHRNHTHHLVLWAASSRSHPTKPGAARSGD